MNTILALHGFLGLAKDWSALQQAFNSGRTNDYEFVPVDYMNIRGLTPDVGLDRWGENFNLWAEKNYPRRKKVIMGYSLGGRLALHAVAQNPKVWTGAVFLSTNPGLQSEEERKIRKETDQKWAHRVQTVDFDRVAKDWNTQDVFLGSQIEPIRHADDHDTMTLAKALTQWSVANQRDFRKRDDPFQTRTLWMAGELDTKYVGILEELEQIEKPLETAVVENASHRLLFDQPEKVAEYLRTFLQELR